MSLPSNRSTSGLRRLLPEPHTATDRWDSLFDPVLALIVVVSAALIEPGSPVETAGLVVAGLLFASRALPRLMPDDARSVAIALALLVAIGPRGRLEMGFFLGATISLYVGWTMASTRRAVVLTGLQAALPPAVAVLAGSETVVWAPWSGATVGLLVLGLTLRDQDKLIAELEATRETLAEGAVAAERRRLAREVHDLAGHSVAAVLLHVTGARLLLRRDPAEWDRALLQAEEAGRKGMEAIRAAVTTLRTTERGDDPPLPRTSDLGHLVDGYRRAGLSIRSELSGLDQIPDGPVAVAVHRIVGEALANAARHAAGNTVDIDVDIDVDVVAADRDGETRGAGSGDGPSVRLSVVDRGRRPTSPAGHGFGLVGMAERARSLGGRLTSGPTGDGWRVDAVLPLAPTVANGADLDPDEALGIEAP